jgi:CTP:molybdopterin cytidylyltransferase MocA
VATDYDGLLAPPVLLERRSFEQVAGLVGDVGLREVLRGSDDVAVVPAPASAVDIDTPADLHRHRGSSA